MQQKRRKDPSKKTMTKFYVTMASVVLACLVCVVAVGRFSGSHAPPDTKYWLTENSEDLIYQPVEEEPETPDVSISSEPEPEPAPEPEKEEPIYTGLLLYRIRWGDTLTYISNHSGFTIQELAEFNHIEDPNLIYTQRFLVFPVGLDRDVVVDSMDYVESVLAGNFDVPQLSGDDVRDSVNQYVDVLAFREAVAQLELGRLAEQEALEQPEPEVSTNLNTSDEPESDTSPVEETGELSTAPVENSVEDVEIQSD